MNNNCIYGWLICVLPLFSVACSESEFGVQPAPDSDKSVLVVPSDLPMFRAVDPAQVTVTASLNNTPVSMQRLNTGAWRGTLDVPQNTQYRVVISWTEQYQGTSLTLGIAEDHISTVGSNAVNVAFNSDQIDTSFDTDGDGRFNLAERSADTNPLVLGDPDTLPTEKVLSITVQQPSELDNVSASVYAVAIINSIGMPLVSEPPNLRGNARIKAGNPVFVDISWYHNSYAGVRLARLARSIPEPDSTSITLSKDAYRMDYDADSDGVSNLAEINAGTNPKAP